MLSIRAPKSKKNQQSEQWKQQAQNDRRIFKTLFKRILSGLISMCKNQLDDPVFQQFVNAPKEIILNWCETEVVKIETVDETENLINSDEFILPCASDDPPANIYS